MYPLAVLGLFIGIIFSLNSILPHMPIQKYSEEAIAKNFCVYRLAVANYIQENSNVVSISDNALELPDGFIKVRDWRTRISNGYCYIYGEATPEEIVLIRKNMGNSVLIGRNQGNRLYPSGIVVNAVIPAESVVSIVSLP
ncbi:MAG: type IV pilus biogenesis protein PilM [Bilophila wadsworthia]|uniref:type IV pilus biogenesis protein PilM n=1 Tax=Bilophila wadsworthia TaxID=35833 RepID=UPI00290AE458|nr:type IV pilus biogenesis protein PilM [Bilophila wadsworthia]MDU4375208.1 type IV pilus biogenesis protein PilM [Bilophila wadsworthia]